MSEKEEELSARSGENDKWLGKKKKKDMVGQKQGLQQLAFILKGLKNSTVLKQMHSSSSMFFFMLRLL